MSAHQVCRRQWCILDIMLNLPRHPISDELLKIILWALKMLGVKNVPSLKAFRQFQTRLRQAGLFQKGQSHVSVLGNHFTSNSILQSIRLDMANPEVRNKLVFYPEEPVDGLSELRHSWKWFLGLPDNRLTPMWAARGVHFYVGEAACLESGEVVVPLRWYICRGEMYMFYFSTRRPASDLQYNLPEMLKHRPDIRFKGAFSSRPLLTDTPTPLELGHPLQANEWRSRANGRPCYVYFILLGGDDVSGNRSKTWNKHWCFYFCAAGLPLACMNQEYFVHFVSTSQHAGPVEQVAVITGELRSVAKTGLVCIDVAGCESGNSVGSECLIIPDLFVKTGDGPWQSEMCSHSGDSKPCRFCNVGGTVQERSSDDGFLAIMKPGEQRTPLETIKTIEKDLALAVIPRKGTELEKNQQKTGIIDSLAQTVINELVEHGKAMFDKKDDMGRRVHSNAEIMATLETLKAERLAAGAFINSLLTEDTLSFDPHQDTAVGRLHLVLLGFTKYFWSASLPVGGGKKLSLKEKEVLAAAEATLFSLSQVGLGERSLRPDYIMHFRGSLVGRHLHSIAQLAVFIFARIVEPVLHAVWVSLSRLCAMLFVQVIKNMDKHKSNLTVAIDNFYDCVCAYNPTWIMYKNKFHYLAHIPIMVERFGVLGLVAEDRFEKFHGLWRHSSIYSNHHAASRDSAAHFDSLDASKHILSGGLFEWEGRVIRAGVSVLTILSANPQLRQRLGLRTDKARTAGTIRKGPQVTWGSLNAHTYPGLVAVWPPEVRRLTSDFFESGQWIISQRGDTCRPGSFVWCQEPFPGVARISAIYVRATLSGTASHAPNTLVVVDLFEFGERHATYDCPILTRSSKMLVLPEHIRFVVNVQHDCARSDCEVVAAVTTEVQERQSTQRRRAMLVHKDDTHYVLNIFVLQHYDELAAVVPPTYTTPSPCSPEDRHKSRLAGAEVLRRQIKLREKTRGAVRTARSEANGVGNKEVVRTRPESSQPPRDPARVPPFPQVIARAGLLPEMGHIQAPDGSALTEPSQSNPAKRRRLTAPDTQSADARS
ncbi:hypothetical protein C8Q79DRAFT_915567 [Trametes meyenii]|nr:hypothetical protein C8Q79DRAFT_915567 [Trametes meyenii]